MEALTFSRPPGQVTFPNTSRPLSLFAFPLHYTAFSSLALRAGALKNPLTTPRFRELRFGQSARVVERPFATLPLRPSPCAKRDVPGWAGRWGSFPLAATASGRLGWDLESGQNLSDFRHMCSPSIWSRQGSHNYGMWKKLCG